MACVLDVAVLYLKRRDGTLRGEVLIDDEDYAWLSQWQWHAAGTPIPYVRRMIYTPRPEGGRTSIALPIHRQIMGLEQGDPLQVDHINRDTFDNRRQNLRVVTKAQNAQNTGARPGSSSVFRGVGWDRDTSKWRAYAMIEGRLRHLGRYDDEREAARVASDYRRLHMPCAVEPLL